MRWINISSPLGCEREALMIRTARIWNFKCFRGEHTLSLNGGVFAVVAELDNDRDRSNFLGKTTLLTALGAFPLFGDHGERLEDDWITAGENEGGVELRLADGLVIARSRPRGVRTALEVRVEGEGVLAQGEKAQALIEQRIGLSRADFYAWACVRQKQMAAFIEARPGDRQKVIAGWLQLAPLEAAASRASKAYAAALADQLAAKTSLADAEAQLAACEDLDDSEIEAWTKTLEAAQGECEQAQARHVEAIAKRQACKARADKIAMQQRALAAWLNRTAALEGTRQEVARLEAQIEAEAVEESPSDGSTARDELVRLRVRRKDVQAQQAQAVARLSGGFDGACPVVEGFSCPATASINARRVEFGAQRDAAQAELKRLDAALKDATARADADVAREARRTSLAKQLAVANAALAVDIGPRPTVDADDEAADGGDEEDTKAAVVRAQSLVEQARTKLAELNQRGAMIQRLTQRILECEEAVARQESPVATARVVTEILSRQKAQRLVAESALLRIEAAANASLADAGIALRVKTSWARPTKELEEQCGECGLAFPRSKAVLSCERCGAARSAKLDERLDLELSNRSGGAEDLAGWAYTLAAGAHMRAARSSPWTVGYFDEPFGALDVAHSRRLARYIAADRTFAQVFVVAHDAALMTAMPGRILITGSATGSTVRVET